MLADLDLAKHLTARGLSVLVTPESGSSGHEQLVAQLADCGAGVTAVDYAIAETGTIVLSSDERNALLVSLLPQYTLPYFVRRQISASWRK